jgi:hypothetical protein
MASDTQHNIKGWTLDTLAVHLADLRAADQALLAERDRRYAEVKVEQEKALRIKDEADKVALGLQRDTQQYKDEKANELRSQIERERGEYVTRSDLASAVEKLEIIIKPLASYVPAQQGGRQAISNLGAAIFGGAILILTLTSIVLTIAYHK